jgi:tRNA uridine 5-carbamoylmethylation protein Kti12
MNDLSYNERKEWAKALFTHHDKTIEDIALSVGTDNATVRGWIAAGGWNAIKRSLLISKDAQLQHMYDMLEALNQKVKEDPVKNTKDLDAIIKYTAAIKNLETDTTISNIIEVSDLFLRWLRRRDLDLAKKLTVQFDTFVQQKIAA